LGARTSTRKSTNRREFMSATSVSFGLLIVLFTILLVHWMRRLKPQLAGFNHKGCARLAD
jgi:hypothetical protein